MIKKLAIILLSLPTLLCAQINTERVMAIGRNALYFEDYVLSIQYFNQVINAKSYLCEPYFFRGLAKINLDDFQGAEEDCSLAIDKNPFVISAYQVRGLARIRQNNYKGAIEDYNRALEYDPESVGIRHNLTLCHIQNEDYNQAAEELNKLIALSPKYTRAYLMRGEVALKQKDTIRAMQDFDLAIEMDKYDGDTWASRAIVQLQQQKYKEAESDLDQAIHLTSKSANNYINRALARYNQKNLRGAMNDYDLALDIDPRNFLGHYNRGLLRAQVGDDNRAIDDFNYVIEIEPENMMAIFNRGLLKYQTGDMKGAIKDYSTVIKEHPNFLAGYYNRAQAKRKLGDTKGADADEFKVMKAQLDKRTGTATADKSHSTETDKSEGEEKGTRKKSDKNMSNYGKIVVADNEETEQKYKNDYRGKVQDRNVSIQLEPMFVLTYYEKESEVRRVVNYHKFIDDLNRAISLPNRLIITNKESALTETQMKVHFASIDERTSRIVSNPTDAKVRFARSLDFYLVQDFSSSIEDLTQTILCDEKFFPAYFNRALIRYKQLEYKKAEHDMNLIVSGIEQTKSTVTALDYDVVKNDLDKVINLAPDFVFAYYNRGNVLSILKDYRAAIVDYDKAIALNPSFAEAYFNRGLTHIFLGNNRKGMADLSKSGELGIVSAYNVIKRFTEQTK